LIDEIVAEIDDGVTEPPEAQPLPQYLPATAAEQELIQTLALIQQRQDRLKID
jgi:hypothetical protein